jgi:dihydroorotate dehydrogenase
MPDYTYHPLIKPLLFSMPVEESRRFTLRLLELQSRTVLGRRVFRFFGHGLPPEELSVSLFGLHFPGPIGLAPGIDIEGTTLSVMQHLGFGFMTVGPVGTYSAERRAETEPLRLIERHALIHSQQAGGPRVGEVAERIRTTAGLRIPVGIALRGECLDAAIRAADGDAAFFTLPPACAQRPDALQRLRTCTQRPLLVRLSPELGDEALLNACGTALAAGLNGCVVTAGLPSPLLPEGEMDGPFLHARALKLVALIAQRHGSAFPVIGAGGIMSPEDALSLLDAGAPLIELYAGLVYAGPGLPARIIHALEHRLDTDIERVRSVDTGITQHPKAPRIPGMRDLGWLGIAITGLALLASGLFALILAATVKLLPYDVAYLGTTVEELCARNQCRIVHFMAHDRVSFGGSIMSIGALYLWLAFGPMRSGEPWAWWTLLASGMIGFASFLTYLGHGYLDVWHGWATLALLPFYLCGMWLSFSRLRGARGPQALLRPGAKAWLWSPAGMGRALLLFTAIGMILGGLTIMIVGMTTIFVPQDLEFMEITTQQLNTINPRLVPLIAHDRAGFGGGLCSGGLAILFSAWCGLKPGARSLWWIFLVAGSIGFATAIGIHPIVGYTSFLHLLPAYVGATAFLAGMYKLWKPVCRAEGSRDRFSDL